MDLGINLGVRVICVGISPLGNPKAYSVRGIIIAIRNNDAENVVVLKE
jgi:ferrous iron transport protein A